MSATQNAMILEHLKCHGSITVHEAQELYAVERLSARIDNLKKAGITGITTIMVKGINRFGEKVRFGRYVYTNTEPNKDECPECSSTTINGKCPICYPRRLV